MSDEPRIPGMDTDIRDELERSFGDGPPITDDGALVRRGRQALRRRRLAEAGTGLVIVAVAITGALIATGGSTDSARPPIAGSATAAPESSGPQPYDVVEDAGVTADDLVTLGADGTVQVVPGLEVVTLLRNPWGIDQDGYAVALKVRYRGTVTWAILASDDGGGTASFTQPIPGRTFQKWAGANPPYLDPNDDPDASAYPGDAPPPGYPIDDAVRFVPGTEQLVAQEGTTILQQRPHPEVGTSFASDADHTAVAEIEYDDGRWYLLARDPADGDPQFIAVPASKGGKTLDAFLELSRQRYAEGGGGLL